MYLEGHGKEGKQGKEEAKDKNKTAPKPTNNNNNKSSNKNKPAITDEEALKVLQETQRLLNGNDTLQAINLLRALRDNMQGVKNMNLQILTLVNLGIIYYQVGFLQEANEELGQASTKLRQYIQKWMPYRNKDLLRIKYQTMLGRIELQLCILQSELGKHDLAIEHARVSSKINYNLIYDILTRLHYNFNRQLVSKNHPKKEDTINLPQAKELVNQISALTQLLGVTKDLKLAFAQKQKITILEEQTQITRKYGLIPGKPDIDLLYELEEQSEHIWIFRNKILDEIQMNTYDIDQFQLSTQNISKNQVIQKIAFLAISLYCYSTETRFIEKQKSTDTHDVLDSEHWLSRSLQIAYSFMPAEAPILNQILTVHQRFHSLDKQTIPEDQEVTGFFKVLKPLTKPNTQYTTKSPGCSPIMIRIQADKVDIQLQDKLKPVQEIEKGRKILEFGLTEQKQNIESITKNNKIRGLSHGTKRELHEVQSARNNTSHATIDNPLGVHINGNIRGNFISRKFGKKEERIKSNLSQLHGKAAISEDLLMRPHSYQNPDAKTHYRSHSQTKKKSVPFRKREVTKRPNSFGAAPIKYGDGLQLKGHKMSETIDSDFFQRLHNQSKVVQGAGGNVYINNNINLFISKNAEMSPFTQTFVRGQVLRGPIEKEKEMSRRQMFMNKRRANNFIAPANL